jgi:hypothetical protein
MDSISREKLIEELREYSQTLELVATVKSAPIAASQAREELPMVMAFLATLTAIQAPKSVAATKVSCAHFPAIKRAFAIAHEAGLDTKADAKMRAAFGRYLGREVSSRNSLSGSEWDMAATAVKCGELAW